MDSDAHAQYMFETVHNNITVFVGKQDTKIYSVHKV